jgi:hemerythrin-like domain-containing protein
MSKNNKETKPESIYDILKEEHKEVKELFKQILDNKKYDQKIFSQIDEKLTVHMHGEEKLLYPKLVKAEITHEKALEAIEEHKAAKQLQKTIQDADSSVQFAKVQVFSEMIDHHVEEEETALFKQAKHVLSKEEEKEIGCQYLKEKNSTIKMAPTAQT